MDLMDSVVAIGPPGGPELIIILLVFILLFGAKKLPELGSSVGKSIKNFKQGIAEGKNNEDSVSDAEVVSQDEVTEQSARKNTK